MIRMRDLLSLLSACLLMSLAPASFAQSQGTPSGEVAGSESPHDLTRADLESWLDGYLPYALERGDVAGAVIAIVKDGRVLFEKGYGYADVARQTRNDPTRTLFRPGSISKLFTWTAVMQQVELGRLNLDADVNTYLDFKIPPRDGQPITLRNLMTHTGGFEETLEYAETNNPADLLPLSRYVRRWVPKRIFPPGKIPAYSNYGTALAGYIVERVSHEPFDLYIARHILDPLGMKSSTFAQPLPERFRARMAQGYPNASAPPKPYQLFGCSPAASLAATADDMAHFMIAHLQDGGYEQARILQPETARMMHGTPLTILPVVNRMLLGFYEMNRNGHRIIGHDGDTSLFHSELYLLPLDGVGVFLSLNSTGKDASAYAIREALFRQFIDRYFPGPAPDGHVDAATAQAHAALIAGEYVSSRGEQSSFLSILELFSPTLVNSNPDGTISVSGADAINGEPIRWREIAPFVWRDVQGKDRLAAKVTDGKVTLFSLDSVSPFLVFQPASPGSSRVTWATLLKLSLASLVLTVVLWPVSAILRRHYAARFPLQGHDATAYRGVRIAAAFVLLVLLGWLFTFMAFINETLPMTDRADGWLILLHLFSLVAFVVALPVAGWNAWRTCRRHSGWFAKLWSVVLVAAFGAVLWIGCAYKLLGFSVNY